MAFHFVPKVKLHFGEQQKIAWGQGQANRMDGESLQYFWKPKYTEQLMKCGWACYCGVEASFFHPLFLDIAPDALM